MTNAPNPMTSLDAVLAFCIHIGRRCPGASEFLRWTASLDAFMKVLHFLFGIGATILLAAGCTIEHRPPPPAVIPPPSADVYNFGHQLPYGILGKQLGTQIVIEGEYDYEAKSPNMFWVNAIDQIWRGAALPIVVRGVQLHKGIHYKLEGYEAGEFSGDPTWLHSDKQPFQYKNLFVVTRMIEPKAIP